MSDFRKKKESEPSGVDATRAGGRSRMQGGGYGGMQGAGGSGRDLRDGSGEIQGGSYGRSVGEDASTFSGRPARTPDDDSTEERQAMLHPPQEVDEDGRETSITDEGRSASRGDLGRTEES